MKLTKKQLDQRKMAGKANRGRVKRMTDLAIEQRRRAGRGNLSESPHRSTLWRWSKIQ
jgi:hypothetical protein